MAQLFKLSAYLVDPNDTFDVSNLEDYLIWRLRDELDIDHIKLEAATIENWRDDHPINYYNCSEAEYEKYFKENIV